MSDGAKFVLMLTVVAIVVGTAAVWTVSTASDREAASPPGAQGRLVPPSNRPRASSSPQAGPLYLGSAKIWLPISHIS
jgi:hypothetical protein